MDREDLAWAAGFFDGEGCFSSPRTTRFPIITQSELDPLERFRRAVGTGKIYAPYRYDQSDRWTGKPQYKYQATGLQAVQAIAEMLWFKLAAAKRDQAYTVLALARTCRKGHPKVRGHKACGQCTAEYWAARRLAKGQVDFGFSVGVR